MFIVDTTSKKIEILQEPTVAELISEFQSIFKKSVLEEYTIGEIFPNEEPEEKNYLIAQEYTSDSTIIN